MYLYPPALQSLSLLHSLSIILFIGKEQSCVDKKKEVNTL